VKFRALLVAAALMPHAQATGMQVSHDTIWVWRQNGVVRTRSALDSVLTEHRLWLTTDGHKGHRANLTGAVLTGASLRHAVLAKAILQNVVLTRSDLTGAQFSAALLNPADMGESSVDSVDFDGAVLDGANFALSQLRGATFNNAVGDGITFAGSYVGGVNLAAFRWLKNVNWQTVRNGDFINGAHFDDATRLPQGMTKPRDLNAIGSRVGAFTDRHTGSIMLSVVVLLIGIGLAASLGEAARQRSQKAVVASAEQSLSDQASFAEHVERELRVLAERERLILVQSSGRSNWLFIVGNALILASVGAPVASLLLYLQASSPEWHLLAFGVAFGLLLLAAARGVARQEGHQRDTYFRLTMRIAEYERSISVLRIATKASPPDSALVQDVSSKILWRLLQSGLIDSQSSASAEPDGGAMPDAPFGQLVNTLLAGEK